MKVATVSYTTTRGWSAALPAALDSPQTLVLAFAAPEFGQRPAPFGELVAAFPRSLLVGCSTSGEIAGAQVQRRHASAWPSPASSTRAAPRVHPDRDAGRLTWAAGAAAGAAAGRPRPARGVPAQ